MFQRSRSAGAHRRLFRPWIVALAALAAPAAAQPASPPAAVPGVIQGQVITGVSHPIGGALITADYDEGRALHREAKTDASGRFRIADLPPGRYTVAARAQDRTSQTYGVIVNPGQVATIAFRLVVDPAAVARRRAAEEAARQQLIAEGINLTESGSYDKAIERLQRAIGLVPDCSVCFFNLGRAQAGKLDYTAAEASLRQAIALKPDYAEAWGELAKIFTARHQFTEAVDAGTRAADLGARLSPAIASSYRYNEGIYLWNAGRTADAVKKFEMALQLDPSNADAHFQLALGLINQGHTPRAIGELTTYLKLAPDGNHAARARVLLDSLRK